MKQEKKENQEKNNKDIDTLKETVNNTAKELKEDIKEKTDELKEEIKSSTDDLKDKVEELLTDIKDTSKKYDKKDINENKAMACLAYLVPPVPYFVETKSKWVHYHSIQGMNLFIIYVIITLLITLIDSLILWIIPFITSFLRTLLTIITLIYSLLGIINVCNGEAKELPIINKFKFIKK